MLAAVLAEVGGGSGDGCGVVGGCSVGCGVGGSCCVGCGVGGGIGVGCDVGLGAGVKVLFSQLCFLKNLNLLVPLRFRCCCWCTGDSGGCVVFKLAESTQSNDSSKAESMQSNDAKQGESE